MQRLTEDIIQLFQNQGYVIVSTIDRDGLPHSACKGIVKINRSGRIYLLDLYKAIPGILKCSCLSPNI